MLRMRLSLDADRGASRSVWATINAPLLWQGVVHLVDLVPKSWSLSLTEAFLNQGSDGIDVSWRDFADTRVLV
jgi:hypothetical protein